MISMGNPNALHRNIIRIPRCRSLLSARRPTGTVGVPKGDEVMVPGVAGVMDAGVDRGTHERFVISALGTRHSALGKDSSSND